MENAQWKYVLPSVLLGIHTSWRQDFEPIIDAVKYTMQMSYEGAFPIFSHSEKILLVKIHGTEANISTNSLKPVYILGEILDDK